ncbi:MAG: xanthan lyase [Prevotella sp.]|nr:xanthan lyase [Prevotella sp.]
MRQYRHILSRSFFLVIFMTWCSFVPCFADSVEDHIKEMKIDESAGTITLCMDDDFASQTFTEKSVRKIYKKTRKQLRKALPAHYGSYNVVIVAAGVPIESLLAGQEDDGHDVKKPRRSRRHGGGWWGDIYHDGAPWVTNVSRPNRITAGLEDLHIALWQSHGRYYDKAKQCWKWQRPFFFSTTEDLFTQTIVVPYLIPMLESAGANVFTPRERDWQMAEVIVDNDTPARGYSEGTSSGRWHDAGVQGFAMPVDTISDGYNPFEHGTVRMTRATHSDDASFVSYQPSLPQSGRYAVYVSYATTPHSIDDALYSVYHKGVRTDFHVNQQMGSGTWVYLGTFDFDAGSSTANRVVLSAHSLSKGDVTADAVRFGGGMGNISRGGSVSGMPRCLEGARYYAQWAGAPYSVYAGYKGENDYKDDINVRSLMTNWLCGGSAYLPNREGKRVPIDLSLAVHSDAGYNKDMQSIYGSLAICSTNFDEGRLPSGISRSHSKDLAEQLLDQSLKDLKSRYGQWTWRHLYDRNYSETRYPAVPSAIFETLSHQSFPDMRLAHDPDFKFTLARSIYKTILRYEAEAHGRKSVVVQPLSPDNFSITLSDSGVASLTWVPQSDSAEPSATPTSYKVYMSAGQYGYDNGTLVPHSRHTVQLQRDVLYRFRITAVNDGGESFPTEELCVLYHAPGAKTVMVVNGFQRLSSPAVHDGYDDKGFDIADDPGMSYGLTAGWSGQQQVFSTSTAGSEGPGTFGYSSQELQGRFIAGNTFDYVAEHAAAIASAGQYNIVSATKSLVEWGGIDLSRYDCLDILLGAERNDGHSLRPYKTFSPHFRQQLAHYMSTTGGSISGRHTLLVSGSYVASDMLESDEEVRFLRDVLHTSFHSTIRGLNGIVTGMQQTLSVTNTLNDRHYATTRSDVLTPQQGAFVAMQYADGKTAAVATPARSFIMGFPLECITDASQRSLVMRSIMTFLLQ